MKNLDHLRRDEIGRGAAAEVSIRIGKRTTFDARMSSAGLLSVGVLVSGILLSSAVIVFAAGTKRARQSLAPPASRDAP